MSYTTIVRIKKEQSNYKNDFEFVQEIHSILKKYDFSKIKEHCKYERITYTEGTKYVYQYTTHWDSAESYLELSKDSPENIQSEQEFIEKDFTVERSLPYL